MASFFTTASASFLILLLFTSAASAQLDPNLYLSSCPTVLPVVRAIVLNAIARDVRMGASLLRLLFHDYFVQGCDASLLLDDTFMFKGEKTANANRDSVRGFDVIDEIKTSVEAICPGIVSCADILAIAARDAIATLGGPTWTVLLGRRDSTTASLNEANSDIPDPNSSLPDLITKFTNKGFSTQQMVALAGAHTIGEARCTSFRDHIYNDTNIDASFRQTMQSSRPSDSASGDNNLEPLDSTSPITFDNAYFINLLNQRGLLHSDQELFNGQSTDSQVIAYVQNPLLLFQDFVNAIVQMSQLSPLTGTDGQIRSNCRSVN